MWRSWLLGAAVVVVVLAATSTACSTSPPAMSVPAASATGATATAPTEVVVAAESVLSAGVVHTCRVTSSKSVECWGWNEDGQLGDGTTTNRTTPVTVAGLPSAVQTVTGGVTHSCALTSVGTVLCWGRNADGQLGDGTTTSHLSAVPVTGLTPGVQAITAGHYQTCALTQAGAVTCWGAAWGRSYDEDGQPITAAARATTPVIVTGLESEVAAVVAGRYHACALTLGGVVKCWGWNANGQLGDGTSVDRPVPVDVIGLAPGTRAIAAGFDHTCGLAADGQVLCWGRNAYGQLGDGTTTDRPRPIAVTGLSTTVRALAAGEDHTCALTNDNAVACWGDNENWQLGVNTREEARPTPERVPGLSAVHALTAGATHTCALVEGDGVTCWGGNEFHQLGAGSDQPQDTPVVVVRPG